MKILVTGATGFLGRHVLARLVRDGDPKRLRTLAQRQAPDLSEMGIEQVVGSVCDPAAVKKAMDGVTHVFHLAGMVSRDPDDRDKMFRVHVEGTRVLGEAARAAGVKRVVLASTSGTLAVSTTEEPETDEFADRPVDIIAKWPYYASKYYQEAAAEKALEATDELAAVELVTVHPSLLMGPGDRRLSSTRDVVDVIGGKIKFIPPGGSAWLTFVTPPRPPSTR